MTTGPLTLLPGGPSAQDAEAAQAQAAAADATADSLEESQVVLDERADELTVALTSLDGQIAQSQQAMVAADQSAVGLSAQSAQLKYQLNPVVIPTEPGYQITTVFGESGSYWSSGHHTGLDFANSTGADVYAAKDGVVVEAGWGGAYGNNIVLQHADGTQTRYAHLSAISVTPGQSVTAGQQIGDIGATGNVTGPHLHFEVMDASGNFMDPAAWLGL